MAKEHYDNHLGRVYSWMLGDFNERMREQKDFLSSRGIIPSGNMLAFDLGAGNGIQSVALATLGFLVSAVDFNTTLLNELRANKGTLPIRTIEKEVLDFLKETTDKPELIVCMGDTLTHFAAHADIEKMIRRISRLLPTGGKLVVSWRDLSETRTGADRFFHVRSDDTRTLSCFLEYFPGHVMVHDLLVEKADGKWSQSVSNYPKLRIPVQAFLKICDDNGITPLSEEVIQGMTYVIGEKTSRK